MKLSFSGKGENSVVFFNMLSTFLVAAIGFLTIPIYTRLMGTAEYGIVSLYSAWVSIVTVVIGLRVDGTIAPAQANLPADEQDAYQKSLILLAFGVFCIAMILFILLRAMLASAMGLPEDAVFFIPIQSFGSFCVSFFGMRFIFRKEAQKNFVMSLLVCVLTTLTSIALLLFLFFGNQAHLGRIIGASIPYFLIGVILALVFVIKTHKPVKSSYYAFCLPLALPLIFHGLAQIVLGQADRLMLQSFYNSSVVGIYSVGVTVANVLNYVYTALNNSFVPFLYEDFSGETPNERKNERQKNYIVLFLCITIALLCFAPELLKIMAPEEYWEAIKLLPILIVGQFFVFLYSFPVNFEFYSKQTKYVAMGTVSAALLNIVLNYVLIPPWGIIGAAVATSISYCALFFFHFIIAHYFLRENHFRYAIFLKALVAVVTAAIITSVLSDFLIPRWLIGLFFALFILRRIWKLKTIF